jgi:hypothetical protein
MTFEEILDQATALLQRRGRVSYRMLTLQLALSTCLPSYPTLGQDGIITPVL